MAESANERKGEKAENQAITHSPIRSFPILYSSYRTLFKIAGYSVIPSVAQSAAEGEVEESCTPNRLRFLDSEDSARNDGSVGRIEKACRSRKCPVASSAILPIR